MHYQLHDIDSLLKPFVRLICSVESRDPVQVLKPIRVLPDTCVELFVNGCEPQQVVLANGFRASLSRSFITSRMNSFMDVQTLGCVNFVSVCFFSGSAYLFFPVSMHDVANQTINLYDLWGRYANEMQEQIDHATSLPQRVQLIQHYLVGQLQRSEQFDAGMTFCLEQLQAVNGQLSLAELASRTGISNRQLVRRFNQYVGISPKEFACMLTFNNALKQLKNYPSLSLTEIAHASGYYDQAHFIHTCRDYSGLTPSQLIASDHVLSCIN